MQTNATLFEKLEEFIPKLLQIARQQISPSLQNKFDEHDAVMSMYGSLIRREREGRFKFADNEELWKLVLVALKRKIYNKVRAEKTVKRSHERVTSFDQNDFFEAVSRDPSPEDVVCFGELIEEIESGIDDKTRRILEEKLSGMTNREIAAKMQVSERLIGRKLVVLRSVIGEMIFEQDDTDSSIGE